MGGSHLLRLGLVSTVVCRVESVMFVYGAARQWRTRSPPAVFVHHLIKVGADRQALDLGLAAGAAACLTPPTNDERGRTAPARHQTFTPPPQGGNPRVDGGYNSPLTVECNATKQTKYNKRKQ